MKSSRILVEGAVLVEECAAVGKLEPFAVREVVAQWSNATISGNRVEANNEA